MTFDQLFKITVNREQFNLLLQATDIISRIHLLQFERIADIIQPVNDQHFFKLR